MKTLLDHKRLELVAMFTHRIPTLLMSSLLDHQKLECQQSQFGPEHDVANSHQPLDVLNSSFMGKSFMHRGTVMAACNQGSVELSEVYLHASQNKDLSFVLKLVALLSIARKVAKTKIEAMC